MKNLFFVMFGIALFMSSCSEEPDLKEILSQLETEEEVLKFSQDYALNHSQSIKVEYATWQEINQIFEDYNLEPLFSEKGQFKSSYYCSTPLDANSYLALYCPGNCSGTRSWLDVNLNGSVSAADLAIMAAVYNNNPAIPGWQVIRSKYPNEIQPGCNSATGNNLTCTDFEAVATMILGYHPCS